MNGAVSEVEVLLLHGSPGSGKTTVGGAVAEQLRQHQISNALIDLDALSIVYPHEGPSFSRSNLRAVWPNYTSVRHVKVILPLVVVDAADLALLREITSGARLVVCELTAPRDVLEERVAGREPTSTGSLGCCSGCRCTTAGTTCLRYGTSRCRRTSSRFGSPRSKSSSAAGGRWRSGGYEAVSRDVVGCGSSSAGTCSATFTRSSSQDESATRRSRRLPMDAARPRAKPLSSTPTDGLEAVSR